MWVSLTHTSVLTSSLLYLLHHQPQVCALNFFLRKKREIVGLIAKQLNLGPRQTIYLGWGLSSKAITGFSDSPDNNDCFDFLFQMLIYYKVLLSLQILISDTTTILSHCLTSLSPLEGDIELEMPIDIFISDNLFNTLVFSIGQSFLLNLTHFVFSQLDSIHTGLCFSNLKCVHL